MHGKAPHRGGGGLPRQSTGMEETGCRSARNAARRTRTARSSARSARRRWERRSHKTSLILTCLKNITTIAWGSKKTNRTQPAKRTGPGRAAALPAVPAGAAGAAGEAGRALCSAVRGTIRFSAGQGEVRHGPAQARSISASHWFAITSTAQGRLTALAPRRSTQVGLGLSSPSGVTSSAGSSSETVREA